MVAISGACSSLTTYNISTIIYNLSVITKFTQSVIEFCHHNIAVYFNNQIAFLSKLSLVITSIIIITIVKVNILLSIFQSLTRYLFDASTRIIASSPSLKVALFSQCGGAQSKQYRNSHFLHIIIPFRPRRGCKSDPVQAPAIQDHSGLSGDL